MWHQLREGDRIKIWPAPGAVVRVAPDRQTEGQLVLARLLSGDGEEVTWSLWWQELARTGAVLFADPKSGLRKAEHVLHPHQWLPAHGKAAMDLTEDELQKLGRLVGWHLVPELHAAGARSETATKPEPAKPVVDVPAEAADAEGEPPNASSEVPLKS